MSSAATAHITGMSKNEFLALIVLDVFVAILFIAQDSSAAYLVTGVAFVLQVRWVLVREELRLRATQRHVPQHTAGT